jgi:hypothetical protein
MVNLMIFYRRIIVLDCIGDSMGFFVVSSADDTTKKPIESPIQSIL